MYVKTHTKEGIFMLQTILDFITAVPLWELLLILFSKIIEVTIGTMRVILITKGYRKPGTILAVFEILLWVFIASRVIMGITEFPMKGIVYSVGFAIGIYFGSMLETRLAVGKILIHVITSKPSSVEIMRVLRNAGHGVTSIDAQGKDSERVVMMIFANRKNKQTIIDLVDSLDLKAVIVANEVSVVQGGYVSPWRRIAK